MSPIRSIAPARALAPFAAALVMGALVLFAPQLFKDGDSWWHLATGEWILQHGRVPHADVFSYTRPGAPWVAHEWLSEVLMALAWRAAGWSGVAVLFALAVAAAAWLLVRRLSLAIGGVTLLVVSVLAFACMGGSLLARPQLLVLPVLVLWTCELLAAREQDRAPRLVAALLMTLWANLHGSYVFGVLLAGAFGLEALVAHRLRPWPVLLRWGGFGLASLAAALVTPHGLAGLAYPFQVMTMSALPTIVEWRAADFSSPTAFEIALLVTLFVCLGRGVRIPAVRLLLLLGLLHMSLQHVRHQLVLAIVAPLILAEPLAEALGQPAAEPKRPRQSPALLALAGIAAAVLLAVRIALPVVRTDGINTPVTALAQVSPALRSQPVFNGYGFGGYLIFNGVKPFIDGRADMYGDAFTVAYDRAGSSAAGPLQRLLQRYQVAWTILPPADPAVGLLDADAGWRRLHADRYAVVHVRATAPVKTPPTLSR